jgi:hypothetical protein
MKFTLLFSLISQTLQHNTTLCGWSYEAGEHRSFKSVFDTHKMNFSVLHCESCGSCSNPHDISIYRETKDTLTEITTKCAIRSILSTTQANNCMLKEVGFTAACNSCWVDNIVCDRKKCFSVCLKEKAFGLFGITPRKNEIGLTPCFQCDEDHCGPAFKACAGANRRRCGIKSDIDRQTDEMCSLVD